MGITIRIFYKNISVIGLDNLPVDKPVIVASNHPNAFMDAMILSVIAKQKINYLARSDAFNTPFKKRLLGSIGLIPIYRIQEGAEQLHKNEETFKKCNELLGKNATILMFPEGICIQEKRLRKLKKGLARIAFGAEEAHGNKLGLLVVPMGINYSNAKNFRSSVILKFGKPIEIDDFIKDYHTDKNKTITEFTRYLESKMAENVIIIEKKENDELAEAIFDIYKPQLFREKGLSVKDAEADIRLMNEISKGITFHESANPTLFTELKKKILDYRQSLRNFDLRDHLLKTESIEKLSAFGYFKDLVFLFFCFPFHLYGLINNYLPYRFAYKLSDKIAKNIEFHSSLNIAFGTFFILFYYAFLVLIVSSFTGWRITLLYAITLPFSGLFSLYYLTKYKKAMGRFRLLGLVKRKKDKVAELIYSRREIIEGLDRVRTEFKTHLAVRNN